VLDTLGIEPPVAIRGVTQSPLEGVSFRHTFNDAGAASRHMTQYFEMFGHRSIYHDGWRAVCPWPGTSFAEGHPFGTPISRETLEDLDHVAEDPAENHDLAAENRPKLIELITLWYVEAGKYNVLPLDGTAMQRLAKERPQLTTDRTVYTYYPATQMVPPNTAVNVINRPHTIRAVLAIPEGGAEGVIVAQGAGTGGYLVYVKDNRVHWAHNFVGDQVFDLSSDRNLPAGEVSIAVQFEPTGVPDPMRGKGVPARIYFRVNGDDAGSGEVPITVPLGFSGEGLSVGRDSGSPVIAKDGLANEFTGTIRKVSVDVSGENRRHPEAEIRAAMAHQ
jgi:arylsulfatase